MNEEKIQRINVLYKKSKTKEGLTPEEKEEQQKLRREYIDDFKRNLRGTLNRVDIKEKDGSITCAGDIPEKIRQKKELRKKFIEMRKGLDSVYVKEASDTICSKLKKCPQYESAESICLYMPINNEVDVTAFLNEISLEENDKSACKTKKLYLPRVENKKMNFYLYEGQESIAIGAYNIPEPTGNVILIPTDKTLVVMPGVAFSRDGYRLGYGGGYYDSYLTKYPQCMKVAVCFKEQLTDRLPSEAHDIKPDIIISN